MGERIRCTGGQHCIVFLLPIFLGLCILTAILPYDLTICIEGLIAWLSLIHVESTKIIVTDRRLLVKRGLILNNVLQININQIESSKVDWPILGKLLNYGTIIVCCSGGRIERLKYIAEPLRIQDNLTLY